MIVYFSKQTKDTFFITQNKRHTPKENSGLALLDFIEVYIVKE